MSNFVDDMTSLGATKSPAALRPDIPADQKISAADWNLLCDAARDLRGAILDANAARLTAGTMPIARIADGSITAAKLAATSVTPGSYTNLNATIDAQGRITLASSGAGGPTGSISAVDYGADPTGAADSTSAIMDADAAAALVDAEVIFPPGRYKTERTPAAFYSLILQSRKNVYWRGIGTVEFFHPDDAAAGTSLCEMLRISDCTRVRVRNIGFDGGWGNAVVYIATASDMVDLSAIPSNTLNYDGDSSKMPASGSFTIVTADDAQILTYTGKTGTTDGGTFTGVSAGTGFLRAYDKILYVDKKQKTAEVAIGSDGLDISAVSTLDVISTVGFPASVAADGYVEVQTDNGNQPFQYTSKNGTQFLGVTSSGSGIMTAGLFVHYVDGAIDQFGAAMQVDPKNVAVFMYGSDGNNRTPNTDIIFEDCRFKDTYGDFVWIGAWTSDVKLINCHGDLSARNGVTLSSFAGSVTMRGCSWQNIFTTAVDSEPVDAGNYSITIDDCDLGGWSNPYHDTAGNGALSIQGGTVGRPAAWNQARNWRVTNTRITDGSILITDAENVQVTECEIVCDFNGTSTAPICLTMKCDNVWINRNKVYSRLTPTTIYNYGAISVVAYQTAANTAVQPGAISLEDNFISARNGAMGIYIEKQGGWHGEAGTATAITAATLPGGVPTPGTVEDNTATWDVDFYAGHQIVMGGVIANIISNTSDTLSLAPLYENYNSAIWPGYGTSWADAQGRPRPAPALGTYVIQSTGGVIKCKRNFIDCRDTDGAGAGGYGIGVSTSGIGGTWAEGFSDMRLELDDNDIRGATGRGVSIYLYSAPAIKYLSVCDNHVWDDQPVPTCTYGVYFEANAAPFDVLTQIDKLILRPLTGEGVRTAVGGLSSGYWLERDGLIPEYVGYGDPEGVVRASKGARFTRKDGGPGEVLNVKEEGGPPIDVTKGDGSLNQTVSLDQTLNLSDDTTTVDNCLIVCALTSLAGSGTADWDQFTNGNLTGFARVLCETDSSASRNFAVGVGVLETFGAIGVGTARNHVAHNEYGQATLTIALTPEIASVAPTYIGDGGKIQGAASVDISPAWEGTEEEGDYAIALVVSIEGDTATCASSGWSELPDSGQVGAASAIGTKLQAFGCRAYKSGMPAPVISYSGTNAMAIMMLFRGATNASITGWDAK